VIDAVQADDGSMGGGRRREGWGWASGRGGRDQWASDGGEGTNERGRAGGDQWGRQEQTAQAGGEKPPPSAPVLKHFDKIKKAILEINSSDYVNKNVLSQYKDNGILYLVAFYSKNMVSAECNYEIYDKKLLIIVRCLKHWKSKLENTDILIKVFINYRNLEYFIIIKEFSRR
jgi:hypothetical protein